MFDPLNKFRDRIKRQRRCSSHHTPSRSWRLFLEPLEQRVVLASDFGDADGGRDDITVRDASIRNHAAITTPVGKDSVRRDRQC